MDGVAAVGGGTSVLSGIGARFADNPFLSLLIAQMRSQSPLDPIENGDFTQQMAQFSSMEEQRQLNENLLTLLEFQGALARLSGLTQGAALIGKEVEFQQKDGKATGSGVVESVRVDEQGKVLLKIGKEEVEMGRVVGIKGAKKNGGQQDVTNTDGNGKKA